MCHCVWRHGNRQCDGKVTSPEVTRPRPRPFKTDTLSRIGHGKAEFKVDLNGDAIEALLELIGAFEEIRKERR
jgi:hypothetical protein